MGWFLRHYLAAAVGRACAVDLFNRGSSQRMMRPGKPSIKAVKAVLM
jgi:hypothetical protein